MPAPPQQLEVARLRRGAAQGAQARAEPGHAQRLERLQEDGRYKSGSTLLGAGCTLGVGAHVHYGVHMGDGVVLAADAFLMKGEEVPPRSRGAGNPARGS